MPLHSGLIYFAVANANSYLVLVVDSCYTSAPVLVACALVLDVSCLAHEASALAVVASAGAGWFILTQGQASGKQSNQVMVIN